jgi:hypothetical protein
MERIKRIDKLTLLDMFNNIPLYGGLSEGLAQMPVPDSIQIGKAYELPKILEEFTTSICYAQRLYLVRKEENDFGVILRAITGYFYTIVNKLPFDEDKALLFGKKVITCKVIELYPAAMQIIQFTNQMIENELKVLHREPSAMERAAGIEKLNVFAELTSLDFLRDAMKCTVSEVLLTPYNECLVRFMIAHETTKFQERYYELMKEENKPKTKFR